MNRLAFFFILSLMILPATSVSQEYIIDAGHSAVMMKVQRFGLVNVIGRFGDVEGIITYNPDDTSMTKIDISVKTESYTANNPAGETSVLSSAFLDSENHPYISFTLINTGQTDENVHFTGNLIIHGVSKSVDFDAKIIGPLLDLPTRKQSIALSGVLVINRLDFGVGPDHTLPDGREIIGNRVEISFEILGISQQ